LVSYLLPFLELPQSLAYKAVLLQSIFVAEFLGELLVVGINPGRPRL